MVQCRQVVEKPWRRPLRCKRVPLLVSCAAHRAGRESKTTSLSCLDRVEAGIEPDSDMSFFFFSLNVVVRLRDPTRHLPANSRFVAVRVAEVENCTGHD